MLLVEFKKKKFGIVFTICNSPSKDRMKYLCLQIYVFFYRGSDIIFILMTLTSLSVIVSIVVAVMSFAQSLQWHHFHSFDSDIKNKALH